MISPGIADKVKFFDKFNNEYVLAFITAFLLVLTSIISLVILAAAFNFSTDPITNEDNQTKVIKIKKLQNNSNTPAEIRKVKSIQIVRR